MNHPFKIVAIDVGFGDVKYLSRRHKAISHQRPLLAEFDQQNFPALAVIAKEGDNELAEGLNRRMKIARVKGCDRSYWIGPNVRNLLASDEARTIASDYCLSDEYEALVNGVLHRESAPDEVADLLVLGLPVSTWAQYKEALMAKFAGLRDVTDSHSVYITRVMVCPQPMGGFYDFHNTVGQRRIADTHTLVVDPGFNTLDWFTVNGTTPITRMSGSRRDSGMRRIIESVRANIAEQFRGIHQLEITKENVPLRIAEKFVRSGMAPIVFSGFEISERTGFNQDACRTVIINETRDSLREMLTSISNAALINDIVVVGGGAQFYWPGVKAAFPLQSKANTIFIPENPQMANVRGYMVIAQRWVSSHGDDLIRARDKRKVA